MYKIKALNKWTNQNSKFYLFFFLRIFLGVFLFMKGVQFMSNIQGLIELISPKGDLAFTFFLAHYISMVHFAGGILIFFGLLTRISLLFQIPILIGSVAVNFINVMSGTDLMVASMILILSLMFIVVGSGKHSLDYNFQMQA